MEWALGQILVGPSDKLCAAIAQGVLCRRPWIRGFVRLVLTVLLWEHAGDLPRTLASSSEALAGTSPAPHAQWVV